MRALKLLSGFLRRQSRRAIRWIAVGLAVLVYKIISGLDVLQLPGMSEPYVIGTLDPYIAAVVAYFMVNRGLQKIITGFVIPSMNKAGRNTRLFLTGRYSGLFLSGQDSPSSGEESERE